MATEAFLLGLKGLHCCGDISAACVWGHVQDHMPMQAPAAVGAHLGHQGRLRAAV